MSRRCGGLAKPKRASARSSVCRFHRGFHLPRGVTLGCEAGRASAWVEGVDVRRPPTIREDAAFALAGSARAGAADRARGRAAAVARRAATSTRGPMLAPGRKKRPGARRQSAWGAGAGKACFMVSWGKARRLACRFLNRHRQLVCVDEREADLGHCAAFPPAHSPDEDPARSLPRLERLHERELSPLCSRRPPRARPRVAWSTAPARASRSARASRQCAARRRARAPPARDRARAETREVERAHARRRFRGPRRERQRTPERRHALKSGHLRVTDDTSRACTRDRWLGV